MRPRSGPPLTRETLALRLRQNWLAKHPVDVPTYNPNMDDSLTSLSWLQNLNIMKITGPTPPHSPTPNEHIRIQQNMSMFSSNAQVNPNAILNMTNLPGGQKVKDPSPLLTTNTSQYRTIAGIEISPQVTHNLDKINYKANPHVKPPYSYATLICMAMRESKKQKITLSGIYNWITENFMYYRMADPSWQNSIRHNLSLNKCFQKVPRRKDEPGKGGFWRINPEFQDMFVNGIFKKRRSTPVTQNTQDLISPPPLKRIKQEVVNDDDSNSSIASLSGLATAGAISALLTPMNSIDETEDAVKAIEIKKEPSLNYSGTFKNIPSGDLSEAIDFSWNAILNQDIEVGGVKVKTEHIIDEPDGVASPITALSPPPSDSNSDISLEDLLNTDFNHELDGPLDLTSGSTLDLTISGVGLKKPEWWEQSLNGKHGFMSPGNHSRMSTPIAQIDDTDFAHPWAEDKSDSDDAMGCFDKDFCNLFDLLEDVPSPKPGS